MYDITIHTDTKQHQLVDNDMLCGLEVQAELKRCAYNEGEHYYMQYTFQHDRKHYIADITIRPRGDFEQWQADRIRTFVDTLKGSGLNGANFKQHLTTFSIKYVRSRIGHPYIKSISNISITDKEEAV